MPGEVTADTPLDTLNLNWTEKDLPEKERTKHVHRLHPYLGKFVPQIAEIFLRKYFRAGQTVCDPFSGSGTTLVQANELGISAIGYDISAFNVLLAKAKTDRYDLKIVRQEIFDILNRTERATQNKIQDNLMQNEPFQLSLLPGDGLPKRTPELQESSEYLNAWFAPQARYELLTYGSFIEEYANQNILKIVLSRSARSARLTPHFDLDFPKKPQTEPYWCYKHRRTCLPTETAFQFLKRYSTDTLQRLADFAALRTDASVTICHADSRHAEVPNIDGILTSPPYVGLIDYHEQHRYAYELLGMEDCRESEIGAARQGASKQAKRAYQEAIAQVFQNAIGAMPSGGYAIAIAGDRWGLYPEIARTCGMETEAILQRHVNRRTGRRSAEFYESVFIWRKP